MDDRRHPLMRHDVICILLGQGRRGDCLFHPAANHHHEYELWRQCVGGGTQES